ncbi:hypothetical protein PY650_20930 [Rhizobium calliandrae]|uniref:Uncharacterized protein n=1 Tax=Rhizobium calliandrae TaxID=1312182 RepID=A0ABT7KIS9_9HYPH|nr:hypothetical protein [Rhizobium calliandrae]MDL2408077.1 hypothetical protein [Rhizobium calliandrae]
MTDIQRLSENNRTIICLIWSCPPKKIAATADLKQHVDAVAQAFVAKRGFADYRA